MKFAELSRIASQKSTDSDTGPKSFKDLWRRVLMESTASSPALLCDQLKLRKACAKLTVKVGNKDLDLVTRRRV